MKIVNDSIKNALKQPTTQRKGRILVNDNYYEVYNVEYYADTYLDGNVVGNAIASQLDFDLPYMDKFQTFKYFDGVWTGSAYEYIDMGTFHVFDEQDEDEFNKHITAFDNLIKFNAPFNDAGGYPKTLFQELQNVCNQAGVNLKNTSIANGEFEVVNNQFVNGESLKTVLKAICQISGTYATIKNDELVLQLRNKTNEIINKNQHQPVTWKRKTYGINQVVLGMSDIEGEYVLRQDDADIAKNGVHKLVINDNPFAYTQSKRNELIDALFNQVRGFGYIPYEMNCEWLNYLDIGDTVVIDDIETIVLRINGKSPKSLESFISAPAIIDSSIEYIDNTDTIKNQLIRTERIIDKNNQTIIDVVEQTTEQNQKISQVVQTVEELNSKISDIADITTSAEDTDAKIEINEVNQSEPIRLVVRPIGESISNLVVSSNMLISDNLKLKQRVIRFTNTNTNEIFDYSLPDDLFYYDSENYDEFILDYDGQSCVINKKVGLNEDGTVYLLETPTTIEYEFPAGDKAIILTEGNYIIEILGYGTGYIFARLMAKNIYTTQFYTKAETNSIISQTSQNIDLSVNQKLSNYSTTTEMNSAISLKANEITSSVSETYATKNTTNQLSSRISQTAKSIELVTTDNKTNAGITIKLKNEDGTQIDSKSANITLSGLVKFTDLSGSGTTTINGSNITTGTIDASKVTVKNLNADNITSGTLSANKINGGTITASAINLGNGVFSVTTAGALTCSNINATGGTIAGLTINKEAIFNGKGIGTAGSCGMSYNIDGWAFWAGNGAYRVTQTGKVICSDIEATGGTVGGFTLGTVSLVGTTYKGTMKIQRGTSASVDLPANGGRLMLGSNDTNGVALTTAKTLLISDNYASVFPDDSNTSVQVEANYGNLVLDSPKAIKIITPYLYINGYTGQTGQISVTGQSSSGQYEYYVAFKNGILVGTSRNPFNTSLFPWLI